MNNEKQEIPRRLMEKGLPIRKISEAARKEKLGGAKPRISEMHYWWTRKPLVSVRTALLGAILGEDIRINTFTRMLGLKRLKKPFKYQLSSNEKELIFKECQRTFGTKETEKIIIFDPFAGAGSIPLEALRCGFSVHSNDYNPVACLITNATIYYPRKFGKKLLKTIESVFVELKTKLEESIDDLYPKVSSKEQILGYNYAWMVECPSCAEKTPLVNNWNLGGPIKQKKKYFIKPIVEDSKLIFNIEYGTEFPKGTCVRGKGKCVFCSSVISNKEIVMQIVQNQEEKMVAVSYRTKNTIGANFRPPIEKEELCSKLSDEIRYKLRELDDYIPNSQISEKVIRAARYFKTWENIFFPRQLLFLGNFIKIGIEIIEHYQQEEGKEFGLAVGHYLACLLAKIIDKNCRLTSWIWRLNAARGIVAFRTYPIAWDHFEVHPLQGASGSLESCIKGVLDGLEEAINFTSDTPGTIKITNLSVLEIKGSQLYDFIVTDPPYLDDVPYPEVSDVFYVWQQKLLAKFLKNLNPVWLSSKTPRDEDLSSNHHDRTDEFVNIGLAESFKALHRLLKDNGILVLFYAHSKLEAWEFVVNALMEAGFQITATYPMITENITSPITTGKASIFSSILLLARKRNSFQKGILEDLGSEIEEKIYPRLEEFWNSGLRHTNLTGAAIGPVLEVITGYEELKSKFGKIDVLNILQLASQHVIKFVLSKHSGKSIFFDPVTAFYLYIAVENINGKKGTVLIPYDNAHILSKSINADLKFMEHHGLIDDGGTKGRKNRAVRFLSHETRSTMEGTILIDAVHRSMKAYSKDGIKGMQEALKEETHNLEEIKVALELLARADNPPGKDGEVARKMLGLRENLKKGDKTLFDYF